MILNAEIYKSKPSKPAGKLLVHAAPLWGLLSLVIVFPALHNYFKWMDQIIAILEIMTL